MKNKILVFMGALLVFSLLLTACGGSAGQANSEETTNQPSAAGSSGNDNPSQSTSRPGISENFQDAMPISTQLGFGTLLLEDTEYAVTPAQAAELLPLWKAARSLSDSDTVADAEMEAIFNQIEDTMSSEQISAISELQMNQEEMAQLMEDLGISFGGGGFGDLSPEMQATAQAARESGEGFPGGGFIIGGGPGGEIPGGGFGGGQGPGGQGFRAENLSPEQQATVEALREERGNPGLRFALVFIDPLIDLLEERAAE